MSEFSRRRVVITGLGSVTGFGAGVEKTWRGVMSGESALREYFPLGDRSVGPEAAGVVELAELPPAEPGLGRAARFGLAAAREAWLDAGLALPCTEPEEVGVCIGASTFPVIEDRLDRLDSLLENGRWNEVTYAALCRERPRLLTQSDSAGISSLLSDLLGAQGLSVTVQAACTSAAQAIGHAFERLRAGEGAILVAGGADSMLSMMCFTGFKLLGSLSRRWSSAQDASRPFDRTRDGFVLAEGAAMLVLEEMEHARSRGARIYAELIGYGSSCDAFSFTDMEPEGRGPAQCMRSALSDAGIEPQCVGYLNAHGTATPLNDRIESQAVRQVFGGHAERGLAVSSTKSQLGHLLCAAGAIELMLTTLAVHNGSLPPTLNLKQPDPDCDLDYIGSAGVTRDLEAAMSNSFGFGGQNGSLVVRRWRDERVQDGRAPNLKSRRVAITGVGVQSPLGLDWPAHCRAWRSGDSGLTATEAEFQRLGVMRVGRIRRAAEGTGLRNRMLRKLLTPTAASAVAAAGEAIRQANLDPEQVTSAFLCVGSLGLDQDLNVFAEGLGHSLEGERDQRRFSYNRFCRFGSALIDPLFLIRSLPNAGLCGAAIEFNMQGPNLNITNGSTSGMSAVTAAAGTIARGEASVAVTGGYDSLLKLETLLGHMGEERIAIGESGPGYYPGEGAVFFVLEDLESAGRRGAEVLAELTGWSSTHSAAERSMYGLTRAARQCLNRTGKAPATVYGDGLSLCDHDAMESAVLRKVAPGAEFRSATRRLGFAGGVTGLYSTLHAVGGLAHGECSSLVWTSDRGRNHVALSLQRFAHGEMTR